ncbi:MAG: hypothetical protein ACI4JY_08330 [Oscillospiraceae bacterium]
MLTVLDLYRLIERISVDGKSIRETDPIDVVDVCDGFCGLVAHCDGFTLGVDPDGNIIVCIDD